MKTQSIELQNIIHQIRPILKTNEIVHAGVFGSFARGGFTPDSDLDILIEFKKDVKKSLLDIARIKLELEKQIGRTVDIVTRSGLDKNISKYVLDHLIKIL